MEARSNTILFWQKRSFETVGKSLSAFVWSMADATVIRGHKFATFEEGVANVKQFCKAGYHLVRRDSRTTVAQYNSKVRAADARLTDLPSDAKYAQRWACKHFGTFCSRGQQEEAKSDTNKCQIAALALAISTQSTRSPIWQL